MRIAIIPAYEPEETFVSYSKALLQIADRLIVVDDGSGAPYETIFRAIGCLPNALVLTVPENHGKGHALKHAFSYCAEHFADTDILVTADCDGQHKLEDVARVCAQAQEHPNSLILGSRDFASANVPPKSLAGNTQMRRWLKIMYGLNIADSQTGLRAFTVQTARRLMKVAGNRFEYETAMLIYAKRNQIPILETTVQAVYPENPADHVTHFRAVRDSLRVAGTLLKHMLPYFLSSSAAVVTDVLIFALLANLVFPESTPLQTLLATVSARVVSSVINFFINCRHIFHGRARQAVVRYYTLWTVQLVCSYGIVFLFGHVWGGQVTIVKLIGDLCLSLISYQVQCRWVYRQDIPSFYGGFARFCRWLLRVFSPRYRCDFKMPDEPVVYVCRHLDMHGPYTTIKWLPKPVHPLVLHVFFHRKTAIRHFTHYTFSERYGKKEKKFDFKAWVAGSVTAPLVNSLQSVPVYRGSSQSTATLKHGLKHLMNQESLIVFADVNYTDTGDTPGPIYQGFLLLGELYRKKTGKSVKFIPLRIHDDSRCITAGAPITVDDYRTQGEQAAVNIREAIFPPQHTGISQK